MDILHNACIETFSLRAKREKVIQFGFAKIAVEPLPNLFVSDVVEKGTGGRGRQTRQIRKHGIVDLLESGCRPGVEAGDMTSVQLVVPRRRIGEGRRGFDDEVAAAADGARCGCGDEGVAVLRFAGCRPATDRTAIVVVGVQRSQVKRDVFPRHLCRIDCCIAAGVGGLVYPIRGLSSRLYGQEKILVHNREAGVR